MIRKFLSKYILEVIPSIVATVVGAYIVTHYINAKPDADKPKAAIAAPATKTESRNESGAATKAEPAKSVETSSESRRPPVKEKAAAKAVPAENTAKAEDNRDANEIAREAIARLRGSEPAAPVEAPRVPETPRAQQPRVSVTYQPAAPAPVQPQVQLQVQTPVPVVNAAPALPEATVAPAPQPVARAEDSSRPMPPADIPQRPLDIRARSEAQRTSVAEDVVSAAKSVFHAVIPGTN